MISGVVSPGATALSASSGARNAHRTAAPMGCFHCGLPLTGARYAVTVDGKVEQTCCRGCQAVAQTIVQHGLSSYYRHRTAPAERSEPAAETLSRLELYDLPEVQRSFVREIGPGDKEATLLLEGITCAACVWLIEQRLAVLAGVRGVEINYAARRARVRWNERQIRLSDVLRAVADLGYRAQAYDGTSSDTTLRRERRRLLWRIFIAGFGMMQVMMYATPAYVSGGDMEPGMTALMHWASLILTLPVMLWSAVPFYTGAWRDLAHRRVGMDVPVTLGILVAFAASVHATLTGSGAVYFDSISMFVFLLLGARYLEMTARQRAIRSQEQLTKLTPALAEKLTGYPGSGRREEVPVALLVPGDHIALRPGAAIPADGVVVEGESAADEALLTGEARPVAKRAGDLVIGGAINLHGPLVVRVERVGQDTVLAGIVRLMDRALTDKPAIALAADRAARWFVAGLLLFTAIAAGAWYVVEPQRALWIAVALLVVSCPCALSLATPTALSAASGALHRLGVLVTRGYVLETLGAATHFVFDKTGTLTRGAMTLIGVIPLGNEPRAPCLTLAARLEARSEHPIGRAIMVAAGRDADAGRAESVQNFPGRGVEGVIAGRRLRIGTPRFVAELNGCCLPDEFLLISDEVTAVALGDERTFLALMTFGDVLRPHARTMVHELREMGKTVCLLSGDRQDAVEHVAHQLGIAMARGEARPEDKLAFVRELQAQGAVVAMIGDGVNDAPVLAGAQASVALGGGTQLARSGADMIVMSERLDALIAAVRIAQRTRRVIRQNLAAAVAYNALALPLAAFGFVTPLVAALGMSLSSLMVVGNALRLLRLEPVVTDPRTFLPAFADAPPVRRTGSLI
ncbi:MAG: heavy metal translocating P-type ATPase [Betaproteobacteria bacterium]